MKRFSLVIQLCFFLTCIGCVNIITHEEKDAAKEASMFSNLAFINQDYEKAYSILSEQSKASGTLEQFKQTILSMHPSGFPQKVTATEFEPIPGQKAMNIFLIGENEKEKFYYRLVMIGTKQSGYKTGSFVRGNMKPPSSKLRKTLN